MVAGHSRIIASIVMSSCNLCLTADIRIWKAVIFIAFKQTIVARQQTEKRSHSKSRDALARLGGSGAGKKSSGVSVMSASV